MTLSKHSVVTFIFALMCILATSTAADSPHPIVFIESWGTPVASDVDGDFRRPHGVAAGPNGFVYVADTRNKRVQQFTSKGEFVRTWSCLLAPNYSPNR